MSAIYIRAYINKVGGQSSSFFKLLIEIAKLELLHWSEAFLYKNKKGVCHILHLHFFRNKLMRNVTFDKSSRRPVAF